MKWEVLPARWLVALALWWVAADACAAVRAEVQPERISLGNTATLTLEADQVNVSPDLAPLDKDFIVRGQSSSVSTSIINGVQSARTNYSIEIEPRREGVLTIPAIRFGAEQSDGLILTVAPAQQGSARNGDPYWLTAELSTRTPYVQQAVTLDVRFYYSVPIGNGNLEFEKPANVGLQQVGEDKQWQEEIEGRRHGVFERRYLLIPERSGPLALAPPRFRGNAQIGGGNGFFARMQSISAIGPSLDLDVRPQPDGASQPWLAVRRLGLARADLPAGARAGEPLLLELSLSADGALSSQLPDLELPAIPDAQVFPEPAQRSDSLVDGQPVATLKRRFAIVPAREGQLQIPEVRVPWWNLGSDHADAAVLAASTLPVAAAALAMAPVAVAPPAGAPVAAASPVGVLPVGGDARPWQWASAALSLALLAALAWGWRRGQPPRRGPEAPGGAHRIDLTPLRRALDHGDLGEISESLRRCCEPAALNLEILLEQIEDAAQREALQALQRLRWAGAGAGEHAAVRAQLRERFRNGPRLRTPQAPSSAPVLPPLYPAR